MAGRCANAMASLATTKCICFFFACVHACVSWGAPGPGARRHTTEKIFFLNGQERSRLFQASKSNKVGEGFSLGATQGGSGTASVQGTRAHSHRIPTTGVLELCYTGP